MKCTLERASFLTAASLLATQSADAHIVTARLGDFYAGALHPLTDLQDLVLWTALGLLAGSLGSSRGRWLVWVLPLGLLLGVGLGLLFGSAWFGSLASAGMMVLIGALLAAGIRINVATLCAIALVLALMRGAVNADNVDTGTDRMLFVAGLVTSGYVFITLVTALTLAFRGSDAQGPDAPPPRAWRVIAIRACGSWIAAIGLMVGGFALDLTR